MIEIYFISDKRALNVTNGNNINCNSSCSIIRVRIAISIEERVESETT